MPLVMTGKVKSVETYESEFGMTLQVKVFTDLSKTGDGDWSELLEVPATDENRKRFTPGAMIENLPVRAWGKPKKNGGAWVKYSAARSAA